MINKKFLESLKKDYEKNEKERRQIVSASNNLLFAAKKIIFKLQREEFKEAEKKIIELEEAFKNLDERFEAKQLKKEGAYKAAAEEYLEGKTFFQVIKEKEIKEIKKIDFSYESYLGGICDLIGELVRYATNQAAKGNFKEVGKIKIKADSIMDQLIDFDMTGYLRNKYDQARGHLRKLEQMAYEIKLKTQK
jgi:predicted translin family RNA/ssDNA-binding protein